MDRGTKALAAGVSELDKLSRVVQGVGHHGLSVYVGLQSIDHCQLTAPASHKELADALEQMRLLARHWVSEGGTRDLYLTLNEIQTVHGFFGAALAPLVNPDLFKEESLKEQAAIENFRAWRQLDVRVRIARRLKSIAKMVEKARLRSESSASAVSTFQADLAEGAADLKGQLGKLGIGAKQDEIADLDSEISSAVKDIDDYNDKISATTGKLVAAGAGTVAGLAVAGAGAFIPVPGLNLVVCFIGLLGAAAGGAATGALAKDLQEFKRTIKSRREEIKTKTERVGGLRAEVAAALFNKNQVLPVIGGLSQAARTLSAAPTAWQGFSKQMVSLSDAVEAERDLDPDKGSSATLSAIIDALGTFDRLRQRVIGTLETELLPVKLAI